MKPGNSVRLFSAGLQAGSVIGGTVSLFSTRGLELGMSAGSFRQAYVPDMDRSAPGFIMGFGLIRGNELGKVVGTTGHGTTSKPLTGP